MTQSALEALGFLSTDEKPREMPINYPGIGPLRSQKTEEHPDGLPAFVLVCCANSAVGDATARETFERAREEGRKGSEGLKYDDLRDIRASNAANLIRGWRFVHPKTRKVVDFPYSPQVAAELMASPNHEWLRKQIEAFAKDDANFMMG